MTISLKNKCVLITGASSGIGKACAEQMAEQGANLIITARRKERLESLAKELNEKHDVKTLPLGLDLRDKDAVKSAIEGLPAEWADIDVLVNNAGLALDSLNIQEGDIDKWEIMIDTNLKGLLYMTRNILPKMIKRNSGHIINVGSIAGQDHYQTGNVYSATKHAVRAISKSTRIDLLGKAIRVSEVAPGAVHTEFSEVRWDDKQRSDEFYSDFEALKADDIADAIVYCATRPLHVDVAEITITPTAQASVSHVHRQGAEHKSVFD